MPTTKTLATYRGKQLDELSREVLRAWAEETQQTRDEEIAALKKSLGDSFRESFLWMIESDRREAERTGRTWPGDYA